MTYDLNGIIVVDKPGNITSAKTVAAVKKIFKAKKAGHAGTLDPFATGVLICCINNATRLARFLLKEEKKYEAVVCLGAESDTQDLTGKIITRYERLSASDLEIETAFAQFKGEIDQFPPVYSALKQNGVPLYKLARMGKPVQKPARKVTIFSIKILEISLPEIRFEVICSAGTYIRTLCADIGNRLGFGGYLKDLKRLACGGFSMEDAVSLAEMEKRSAAGEKPYPVIGMADALKYMPAYVADFELEEKISYGRRILHQDIPERYRSGSGGGLKIINNNNRLLAILRYDRGGSEFNYCCVFNP